jgi:hypothetical protein
MCCVDSVMCVCVTGDVPGCSRTSPWLGHPGWWWWGSLSATAGNRSLETPSPVTEQSLVCFTDQASRSGLHLCGAGGSRRNRALGWELGTREGDPTIMGGNLLIVPCLLPILLGPSEGSSSQLWLDSPLI